MRSPGHPPHQRETERLFWMEIAKGLMPIEAAAAVGASQPVGQRWFHNAGGMPPFELEPLSGRYLSRVAPERCNTRRQARLPGIGRPVEGRAHSKATEDGEDGREPPAAHVCAGATVGTDRQAGRFGGERSTATALDRQQQAPPEGQGVGAGMEPGTNSEPDQARLPRRCIHADQPPGDLSVPLHRGARRAEARARLVPSHRASAASASRAAADCLETKDASRSAWPTTNDHAGTSTASTKHPTTTRPTFVASFASAWHRIGASALSAFPNPDHLPPLSMVSRSH
jgi:hypothetical protein